jgi:hypothetical protein
MTSQPLVPGWAELPIPALGDRVHIERDETRYRSKGTWPKFRGRVGTVVEINEDRERPHLTEYGVVFGKARTDGRGGQRGIVTWFKPYEIRALAPQRHADKQTAIQPRDGGENAA